MYWGGINNKTVLTMKNILLLAFHDINNFNHKLKTLQKQYFIIQEYER